ncbi:MAG: hypothetical protein MJ147_01740 [Clostridia bacterium]|nr:hypothetical protein [Clostridia bacterium]
MLYERCDKRYQVMKGCAAIIDEVLQNGTADIPAADLKIIKTTATEYVKDIFRRLREHG